MKWQNNGKDKICQFGFRKGNSSYDTFMDFIDEIVNGFVVREYRSATFVDLSKAFDCSCHDIILTKIGRYGLAKQYFSN